MCLAVGKRQATAAGGEGREAAKGVQTRNSLRWSTGLADALKAKR